jgi:hypothetical protein
MYSCNKTLLDAVKKLLYIAENVDMQDPSKKKKIENFDETPGLLECGWTRADYEMSLY